MYEQPSQPSLASLFGTVIIFMVVVGYGFMALNTEDAIWFISKFEETPQEMVVFCYGTEKAIPAGSVQFNALTALVNEQISGTKNWDSLSMSDETYAHYQNGTDIMVLELRYAPTVRIHSIYKYFSNVGALVIPLDGRHAKTHAVFGRTGDVFTAGSLHIEKLSPMQEYLASQGICVKP